MDKSPILSKFSLILILSLLALPLSHYAQETKSKKELSKQQKSYLITNRPWTIEVPLWIPGFGGSFAYGDVSIEGEDGVEIENPIEPPPPGEGIGGIFQRLFTKNWYLKFFFLTKIAYEKEKFLTQIDAIFGAVGNSVEFNYNNKEIVQANFRTLNIRGLAGYKLVDVMGPKNKFRYELFLYAGFRGYFQHIQSDLNNIINRINVSPVWFEPIIGVQNQFSWKRFMFFLQGDYGGYFVPEKLSFQLTSYLYYRSGKLTSLKVGWNHLYLKHEGKFLRKDYDVSMSLSGPSLGLVFHF